MHQCHQQNKEEEDNSVNDVRIFKICAMEILVLCPHRYAMCDASPCSPTIKKLLPPIPCYVTISPTYIKNIWTAQNCIEKFSKQMNLVDI